MQIIRNEIKVLKYRKENHNTLIIESVVMIYIKKQF